MKLLRIRLRRPCAGYMLHPYEKTLIMIRQHVVSENKILATNSAPALNNLMDTLMGKGKITGKFLQSVTSVIAGTNLAIALVK
jgi:hypothetical protein